MKLKLLPVNPERCIGCGICEYNLPVADRPAIRVVSVGESRNRENRLNLKYKANVAGYKSEKDDKE